MAYSRTNWTSGETPLSAENMNNIEDGIEECKEGISDLNSNLIKIVSYNNIQITWSSTTNPNANITKDISLSGYTPIALGFNVTGTMSSVVYLFACMITGNNAYLAFRKATNPSSVTENSVDLKVTYVKSSVV